MKDERYIIFSEFYNLIKTAEESDDESESSYEEEILNSEPELLEVSPDDIVSEESEDPGSEEDFYSLYGQFPREFSGEFSDRAGEFSKELHDKSDEEFAKIIIQNNPSIFFKQMLDKKFPNLVLDGLNMLFLKEGGHEDFFRDIQRNGTPLYKDYPKSVQSFILNKTPVDFYVEYLQDEFPQYKEILGRRWRGVPNNEYGLEEFFRDGTWAINEEETLAKIEQFASDFSDRDNAEKIRAILLTASPILFSRNKEKLKDIFEIILSQFKPDYSRNNIDRCLIAPFLYSKLYKFYPDILNKIIEIISAYEYFRYKVYDLDSDQNRIKATILRFIEAGAGSYIPEEFRTEDIQKALAQYTIIRCNELEEDIFRGKATFDDLELRNIYRYLEVVNGENFSAQLSDSYNDKIELSKGASTKIFSFTEIFSGLLSLLGDHSYRYSELREEFFEFLFTHNYNTLLEDGIYDNIDNAIAFFEDYDGDKYPDGHEDPFPIFYKNKLIRSKLIEQSPNYYEKIVDTMILDIPNKWISSYANENPSFDADVIKSLGHYIERFYNWTYGTSEFQFFLDEILENKDWSSKHYDELKNLILSSFATKPVATETFNSNVELRTRFIYWYFKNYRDIFPDLMEENIEITVDSERKTISVISAFLTHYPVDFFSTETIASNEDQTDTVTVFEKSFDLVEDYPEYIEFAAKRLLVSGVGHGNDLNTISFVLNSKQISDDIRSSILKSNEFDLAVGRAVKNSFKKVLSNYGNLFYDRIRKNIVNSIKYYSETPGAMPGFFRLFYSGTSVPNASLFGDLSEMGYRAILNKVFGDTPSHIIYIKDKEIHSDIYKDFVKDKNLFELFDFYRSTKRRVNAFHREVLDQDLFRSKLFEELSKNNSDSFDIIEDALSDPDSAKQFYRIIYMDSDIWNLALEALLKFVPDIFASIMFLKLSTLPNFSGAYSPNTSGASVEREELPEVSNPADLLSRINFDSNIFKNIEQRFRRSSRGFISFINFFNNEYRDSPVGQNNPELIYEIKKLLLNRMGPSLIIMSTDKTLIDKSVNKIIDDARVDKEKAKEISKLSYDPAVQDRLESALFNSIERIGEGFIRPETKVEGLADYIIEMLKLAKPILFFKAVFNLENNFNALQITSKRSKEVVSSEFFDLNLLDNLSSERKENLNIIAKSNNLSIDFFKKKYDKIISKDELQNLLEVSIDNDFRAVLNLFIKDSYILNLEEKYPDLMPIVEELVIDEIIHNSTSKKDERELFKNDLYKRALKLNKLTLDELLSLYIFSFKQMSHNHGDFLRFISDNYPDKFNNFVAQMFKEMDRFLLSDISEVSKSAKEYIIKDVITNIDNYNHSKVSDVLKIEGIFSNPNYELIIKDLILNRKIIFDNRDSWVKYEDSFLMEFHDFVSKNYVFYKKHKDDLPTLNPSFKLFRKIKNRELAIELLPDLKNEYFLKTKAVKSENEMGEIDELEEAELNKEINKDGEIKIGESIYQDAQRPSYWDNKTRYTLSLINANPTPGLYDINKKLIHAGDGVAHTNVGVSGFTSAWALFSIQEGVGESYFVVEQYQSDYPVVLHNIFNAKEDSNYFEAKNNLKKNNPDEYKDLSAHFNVISAAYPYVVLAKAIKTAEIARFSHIYILKNVGEMASIGNPEKAKKLYEDIPLMIASGTKTIRGEACWEIEVSKENINKLESKARQVTGKDSDYRFSLTPRQNSEIKRRERENRKKAPWVANEKKLKKLKDINLFLKERFPEAEVPTFNKPVDIIKFIQTDIRKYLTKRDFNREMIPIIRELSILKRSWERMMSLRKFGRFCMNKTRVKQIEGMLIRSLHSAEGQ